MAAIRSRRPHGARAGRLWTPYVFPLQFAYGAHGFRSDWLPRTRELAERRQGAGLSILGLVFLAILSLGSIKKGHGQTARIFGASWFLGAYLPVSNIVQLNATVAEHWLYLPSVGLLIFLAGCVIDLPRRYGRAIVGLALLATAGLGFRSYIRSTDWVTAETFYRRISPPEVQVLEPGLISAKSTRIGANSLKPKRYFVR